MGIRKAGKGAIHLLPKILVLPQLTWCGGAGVDVDARRVVAVRVQAFAWHFGILMLMDICEYV